LWVSRPHTILFVCSGNTCRSPMAEAIARSLLAAERDSSGTVVRSAGTGAEVGCPATPEALAALAKLGIDGQAHRSEALTPELIEQADIVFTMTSRHADAVRAMAPDAAGKVLPVDPEGDIADPIGGPQPVYDATAARLKAAIARRLKEIEA
jgi:L-threonylcarbamoyladenylate synthase